MIKKNTEVSPFIIKRRYLVFLIPFLLISSFSQAVCKPEEAYANTPKEDMSAKIYISEGATISVAEGTTISGAELIHTFVSHPKTKTVKKKRVKKPKAVKKTAIKKASASSQTLETISSGSPKQSWGSSGSHNNQTSVIPSSSFKSFAVVIYDIFIAIIFLFAIIKILFDKDYSIKTLLIGHNFLRPPPSIV